jgi:uncharacterized membrane protein YbaN (DUF454 family)
MAVTAKTIELSAIEGVQGARRALYLSAAACCFALAVLGILLPGLPTTPWLLVTSYLLSRASPRLNRLLLSNRVCGPLLSHWHRHRGVTWPVKISAMAMCMVAVAWVVVYSTLPTPAIAGVVVAALIGMAIVWRLPVVPAAS